ncbi:GMC family oxidoreductase [Paenibacillus sp. J5C_2022]|uniref:GMC family oxidoreductase n=1 Tax=Paenibacillus sp. J5C2022 TaxID=2977129 RepID=UPI0021D32849|nr:GMC family oxidoreductase [Paenibacillus sp. J5C2022]MCU6709064.1 GMC family oxidoreductase [Paenibacillus sp. J5C2022]
MSDKHIFDYIVIGAGTAGGVIAKELTDDMETSVLVLEAGTRTTNSSPSLETANALSSDHKLSFNTLSSLEANISRQLKLSGGRVIGGSSQHNFMYAVRGSRNLYNEWAKLVGNQWSYKSIRSLFKQNETYTGNTQRPSARGTTGPIYVRQQIVPDGGLTYTLARAASRALDIPIVQDYNTGIRDCTFFKSQFIQQEVDGKFVRSSTATGYLNKHVVTQGNEVHSDEYGVGQRKLVICAKTTVNKILFKKEKRMYKAVGVEFIKNGVSYRHYARREVILSAGIFSSAILQRSGIGRKCDLTKAGIKTLVNSPQVGYNFRTHYFAGMGIEVETSRLLGVLSSDPDQPIALGAFKKGNGPGRRLQLLGAPLPLFIPNPDVFANQWGFNPEAPSNVMSIAILDVNPRSTGKITVTHSDPTAYPSIEFNPLENASDLNYMVDQYIQTFRLIMKARELDPEGIYRVVYPSEDVFHIPNEAERRQRLSDFVKASYTNFSHFGGHCRMGRNSREGVVDGYLNVFGTRNLKIADLSIAPYMPDGNTSAAAQMIGLNAVRFIRET